MSIKINKQSAVAFSGHRDVSPPLQHSLFGNAVNDGIPGNGTETITVSGAGYPTLIKERTKFAIEKLCNEGYKYFLCGMAEGFDLLAGETVLELKHEYPDIHLVSVIPFPKQASAFKEVNKLAYERILAGSSYRTTVCPAYSYDCFHKRNDYLISNSDVLVCFFNGTKGGTEYTVKQAVKKGLKIINTY